MLDVQRYRGALYREEIHFTQRIMWGHLIFGAAVVALFLFHEVFWWCLFAVGWYALSLCLMYGMMSGQRACRVLLALMFLAGTSAGVYFVNRIFPVLQPPRGPLIPHSAMPIWLGFANVVYVIAGLAVLFNPSVKRASNAGFTLW